MTSLRRWIIAGKTLQAWTGDMKLFIPVYVSCTVIPYKDGRLKVMLAGKDSAFSVKTASESIHLDACSHVFSERSLI